MIPQPGSAATGFRLAGSNGGYGFLTVLEIMAGKGYGRNAFLSLQGKERPLPLIPVVDLGWKSPACPVTGMYSAVLCSREPLFYGDRPRSMISIYSITTVRRFDPDLIVTD